MKKLIRVTTVILGLTLCMVLLVSCGDSLKISVGMKTSNWGDKWNVSFKKSTEVLTEKIKIKEDENRILYVTGSCESGYLQLELTQGKINKVFDISNQTDSLKINLNEFTSGSVEMILSNKEAKNAKFNSYWE